MTLSDGARTTLHPGDVLVQLGNAHGFENNGTEWVRMVGVTVEARAVEGIEGGGQVEGLFMA